MLEAMQTKIAAEAKKEEELFEKYMCWCSQGAEQLTGSIDAAETKIPQVTSDIQEAEATLEQTKADLKAAQAARSDAKAAMAEATSIREKEAKAFAAMKSEADSNIAAMGKATDAIEKGMSGAFLQTKTAKVLQNIVVDSQTLSDFDRNLVVSFLAGENQDSYTPASGQIVGILKEMLSTMEKDLADETSSEETAKKNYEELMAAKTKEVEALTKAIEQKTTRIGDLGVEIATMKGDLDDTSKALLEDSKFLKDLDKNCAAKKAEWAEIQKMRAEEAVAIAETIKILNSDDALELFKKTLPGSSLLQMRNVAQLKMRALSILQEARKHKHHSSNTRVPLDLITMALLGRKVNFDKVLAMIDELVAALKKEQADDDDKKEYCTGQIDALEDKKKVLMQDLSDLETMISETTDKLKTTADEIETLEDGIKKLDKEVAEASENRKEENEDYTNLMASDTAAKELIGFAKNRLNKFYNPKLYKPPASSASLLDSGVMALVQINQHRAKGDEAEAPPPPPEAVKAYSKKSEESGGVIAMMDALIADLDKEMQEAEVEEKNAQEEYENFMSDSAEKRAVDSKAVTDKAAAKADMETALSSAKGEQKMKLKEMMATEEVLSGVHGECDWLLQNFDARKAARSGEVDSLKTAKAGLSGADFSFVQTLQKGSKLRGARK
jgi:chromosome segregation ATPase